MIQDVCMVGICVYFQDTVFERIFVFDASLCSDQCSSVELFCVKTRKSSVFLVAM